MAARRTQDMNKNSTGNEASRNYAQGGRDQEHGRKAEGEGIDPSVDVDIDVDDQQESPDRVGGKRADGRDVEHETFSSGGRSASGTEQNKRLGR